MSTFEGKVIGVLEKRRARLVAALDRKGGRGVELADAIDRLGFAIDALRGDLHCPHCAARLTSAR